MEYPDDSNTYGCTGFLVNEDTVITAGHCVHNSSRGGWAENIDASLGRNGTSAPYGTYQNKTLYSVKGWTEKGKPEYDYGAIKLNGSPGDNAGWFGYRTTNSDDLNPVDKSATVSGYPSDKKTFTMWKDTDKINQALEHLLLYQIDTNNGQSGAPTYKNYSDTGQTSIAIHTGSLASAPNNKGARITLDVFDNIDNWKGK
ncbi:MAG TPA: trypsin-like serine protease [Virgibacillus sp.]|nr:trypsin-like serine protease [Virgibacillus sp.]